MLYSSNIVWHKKIETRDDYGLPPAMATWKLYLLFDQYRRTRILQHKLDKLCKLSCKHGYSEQGGLCEKQSFIYLKAVSEPQIYIYLKTSHFWYLKYCNIKFLMVLSLTRDMTKGWLLYCIQPVASFEGCHYWPIILLHIFSSYSTIKYLVCQTVMYSSFLIARY